MSLVLLVHLIFVGLWLGCVLTEAIFERAMLGKGSEAETILANLHVKVDVFIEIPAFTIVAVTGLYMATTTEIEGLIILKIVSALIAIAANIYCVKLVFVRRSHAISGNWAAFKQVDDLQHKIGAVVLFGILGAIVLGALA